MPPDNPFFSVVKLGKTTFRDYSFSALHQENPVHHRFGVPDFLDAFAHVHPLRMVSCSLAALSGKTKHYMLKLELPVNNSREIFTLKIFVP